MKKYHGADGSAQAEPQTFFDKNRTVILVVSSLVIAALLLTPDIYLRRYVPWVK